MNNAQDMSPDFVLMRLVSAAEDDRLDEENGNLSSCTGLTVAIKGNYDCTQNHGHISAVNKAPQTSGTEAPDAGVMATRPALSMPPPPLHSAEAHGYDLTHRGGMGPQLLVFRNISRDSEGFAENKTEDQRRAFEDQAVLASEPGAMDAQHPPTWTLHPHVATDTDGGELCHRHRLITDKQDWPPVVDHKTSSMTEPGWSCTTAQRQLQLPDGPVLELARKFGELGVAPVPEFLLKDGELQRCSCQSVLGSAGIRQGEDPTETSDALLVLEGLGSEEVNGLGINACQKAESQNAEPGAFALKCFPSVLSGQAIGVSGRLCSPACCLLRDSVNTRPQAPTSDKLSPEVLSQAEPSQNTPCSSQASTPKARPDRSTTRAHLSAASGGEKTLKVPGKSRKGSLKIRLSKLFRTKSCSGSNNILDKRPSVTFSISSAGSLVDMSGASGGEQDTASQPGLTRAQSAFSAASFTPVFTGETVSLVDVDISQRGGNSPHPPTPPPPPRRSLSLLDAFFRALPHSTPSPMETPAPGRVAPAPIMCPLRGADSSSFTASLRELERCGWYWGPMNWEDAEMKLRGKPDGSFLVRDSSDPRYILSLSFRSQGVTHHTRMEHYRGTFSLWCHPKFEDRCHSVVEFIERAIMHSKNGKFLYFLRSRVPGLPPTPVQLLYPVSRFSNVKSLQHLCRFCIRQLVRIDHIQELPLPKPLIVYLRKFYYYDPEEEMYLSIKGMRQAAGVEKEAESET
ncbi:suppressor of cytokine signaling 7 isoform X2 [Carassius auratus]|uniref:Suppressor of cytokine signaling 7 n=1 Tax=Carassius auratus TaxID=7957 RepID=A0A6P6KZG6_CARAU|nr:suppressor of cytokine signaling 7-like isoform X2 [Carassius auratus]XP_052466048.1 suppressor of cytokine signaling 7 isoform X2 [Carassius gibelio]